MSEDTRMLQRYKLVPHEEETRGNAETCTVAVPVGATLLSVQYVDGSAHMYAEVPEPCPVQGEILRVLLASSGHRIDICDFRFLNPLTCITEYWHETYMVYVEKSTNMKIRKD